ncbi:hypothetical protein [Tomitella biformata]|uniref:hypothetical protein n=1 Tax=Tomitella biformata TaxID=630403 RepID=UPI0004B81B5C|nr:hypothetical protein [Tomitella biformata]
MFASILDLIPAGFGSVELLGTEGSGSIEKLLGDEGFGSIEKLLGTGSALFA